MRSRNAWKLAVVATGLVVLSLLGLAPMAAASGTFSNTASIGLRDPNTTGTSPITATPYPSSISVGGQTGTISNLTVTLSGINYKYSQDISALLVGPTGQTLSLFTSVGGNSQFTQTGPTAGLNVTLDDSSSTTYPYNTNLPTTGSLTMKPTDDTQDHFTGFGADTFTSPAPSGPYGHAAPTGSDTLASAFDGTNPNGTWSLYVTTDSFGDGTGSFSGGWSLNITTATVLSSTTTTLGSDTNPSFTASPNNSVTFTAGVTSSGTAVTDGTVAFTDGGSTISGCDSATLNSSGHATCTTTFSAEGIHAVKATYSGTSSFVTSSSTVNQEVDNHTVASGNTYANPGTITLPNVPANPSTAVPYASHVYVSGLTGSVSHLSVSLSGISFPFAQDVNVLLVGPNGNSLVLLSNVGPSTGTTNASNVSVSFDDSAATTIPQSTPLGSPDSSVTTKPVDYTGSATDVFPSPAPNGPYGTPAPKGAGTLGLAYDGANPNGTWSLYVVTVGGQEGGGTVTGGWSLNITTGSQALTATGVSSSPNPSYTSDPGHSVSATATVTSGGSPVSTGSIAFTAAGTTIPGCDAVAPNASGQASCATSFSAEGAPVIEAIYSGTTSFATSSGTVIQVVDNHTTVTGGNAFANTAAITLPNSPQIPSPAVPYGSHILASNLGPVTGLTVTLHGISFPYAQDINALLVGPTGSSLVLLSNVGPSSGAHDASNVSVTFDDSAASAIPQSTPLGSPGSSVITQPVDYIGSDKDLFPSPAPGGPYGTPNPKGTDTLGSAFNSTDPNGTWSLYIVTTGGAEGAGSVAGGWSIKFAVASQTVAFTSTAPTSVVAGGPTYTPTTTSGGSGNPVVYSVDGSSTAGACSISSGVVSFTAAGQCVVDANQAGNGNYSAAPQVQQTITVTAPNLTAVKTDSVGGKTTLGNGWTWTIHLANSGTADATFSNGRTILTDSLPNSHISYAAVTVANETNVTNSGTISCQIATNVLTCTASGGAVTLGASTGALDVSFSATASTGGTFANPRPGGVCAVDPGSLITEVGANTSCRDTVTVVAPPKIRQLRAITGTVRDGSNLSITPGSWSSPDKLTYAYQWQRCTSSDPASCTNISAGATRSGYRLQAADVAAGYVTVVVTATDQEGQSGTATAKLVGPVANPPAPQNTRPPKINGTLTVGSYLRAGPRSWSSPDKLTYTDKWQLCTNSTLASCADIPGATSHIYRLTASETNDYITLVVTATDQENQSGPPVSATPVGPVGP